MLPPPPLPGLIHLPALNVLLGFPVQLLGLVMTPVLVRNVLTRWQPLPARVAGLHVLKPVTCPPCCPTTLVASCGSGSLFKHACPLPLPPPQGVRYLMDGGDVAKDAEAALGTITKKLPGGLRGGGKEGVCDQCCWGGGHIA